MSIRLAWKRFRLKLKNKSEEDIFTDIYKNNVWKGQHSVSGTGSGFNQTKIIIDALPKLFEELNISTMFDAPCGDFHWMKEVDLTKIKYIGADIVKEIIQENNINYQTKNISFQHCNLITDSLPKTDLIFCRDCLVHLSYSDIYSALNNMINSGTKYLLTTTFTDKRENRDIVTGQWRPINLERPPFSLPRPTLVINENCTENEGRHADKSLALWELSTIKDYL